MMKTKDLTGKIFGRWKVLYQTEDYVSPKGQHQPVWMCECQCDKHTIKPVKAYVLNRGESASCGCYKVEVAKENNSKHNTYELIDNKYYSIEVSGDNNTIVIGGDVNADNGLHTGEDDPETVDRNNEN